MITLSSKYSHPAFLTNNAWFLFLQICEGYPKLYERATQAIEQAKKEGRVEPLFIRPSAQWYTYEERLQGDGSGVISASSAISRFGGAKRRSVTSSSTKATRDEFGVWHVCYSMHSSREELRRALEILNPIEVISTTPHCGACDLAKSALPPSPIIVNEANSPANETTITAIEHCALEDREHDRGKRDYSCSPAKVVNPVSNADSPVPLFGSAQFVLPTSPPVSFLSPCPPVPCSHVPGSSSLPIHNVRAKRLFVEPEPEVEIITAATKNLPPTPCKRRYGSDPVSPVDESSTDLKTSPPYIRSVSMPNPPSVSEEDGLSERSKSLPRLPSRRKYRIPDPLPSLVDMMRNSR